MAFRNMILQLSHALIHVQNYTTFQQLSVYDIRILFHGSLLNDPFVVKLIQHSNNYHLCAMGDILFHAVQ